MLFCFLLLCRALLVSNLNPILMSKCFSWFCFFLFCGSSFLARHFGFHYRTQRTRNKEKEKRINEKANMTFARNSNIDSVEIRMLDTFFFALSLSFTGWFVLSARQFIFGSTRFILSLNLNSNIWVNLYNNSIVKWKQIYLLKSRTKMKRNKIECAKWFKTNVIASQFNNKHNFIVLFLVRPNFVVFLSVFVGFRVSKKWTKKNCSTFLPLFNCNQCQRDGKSSLCYLFGMNFIFYFCFTKSRS